MELTDLFIIKDGDLVAINEVFNIPEGVTELGRVCFDKCNFIREINIPATCVDISLIAFEVLDSVLAYNVDENNPAYASLDGCIYSKDKKRFIKYPRGREQGTFYFNDEVEVISSHAMNDARGIKNICIGKNVRVIESYAFGAVGICSSIAKVYIPSNVTEIDDDAFNTYDCYGEIIIGGKTGSVAQKFALKNEILFTEVDESNLEWFFSLSYDEHRRRIEEEAKNETEFFIASVEKGFSLTFNKDTLTVFSEAGGATLSDLKELISGRRREKIKHLVIGKGISRIEKGTFNDFYSLEGVEIGADVCEIDAECFFGDYNIRTLTVDSESKHFKAIDNIVYSYDLKRLIKFPPMQQREYFEIPSHVEVVGRFSFSDTSRLQCIRVGDNVSLIERGAFACFGDLLHIYIAKNVAIENTSLFFTYDELRSYVCYGGLIVGTKRGGKFEEVYASEIVSFCHLEDDEIDDFLEVPITRRRWIDEDPYEKRCAFSVIDGTLTRYKGKDHRAILPSNITAIGEYAFTNAMHRAEYVFIPSTVTKIDPRAFFACPMFYIEVDKENPAYTSRDGILYLKDGKTLALEQDAPPEELPF